MRKSKENKVRLAISFYHEIKDARHYAALLLIISRH